MAATPLQIGAFRTEQLLLIPGHGARFRRAWLGGSAGSRITRMDASTNSALTTLTMQLAMGKVLTQAANMGTANFVDNGGVADTITRSTGSFITDGWVVGDRVQVLGATTLANDFNVVLTGVSALTLTLATGGGTVSVAEALAAGTLLYRLLLRGKKALPTLAGTSSGVPAISLLDSAVIPSLDASPNRKIEIGAGDAVFVGLSAALSAGETCDVTTEGGDF